MFLEDVEYIPLQRFQLGHWGLPAALEKLCSNCFLTVGFVPEGICSDAVTLLTYHLQNLGSA